MAFNGSGTFSRLYNWVTDRDADVAITASRMDDEMDGMATGLSTCIAKDGQTTTTAAIPFAGGAVKLADGSAASPSVTFINDTNSGAYWIAADNFALVTGGVKILELDGDAASAATGLKITNAAAASGADLSVISSGTNENLTINAKGAGTVTIGNTSTGAITLTRATTLSAALTYGGVTLSNAVTGTGNMVLSASPTLTGTLTAAAASLSGALTYGGVTLTAGVTGTGSMVLSSSPSFTGTVGMAAGGIFSWNSGAHTLTESSGVLTSSGIFVSAAKRSGVVTVADDAATSITIPGHATANGAMVLINFANPPSATYPAGIIYCAPQGTATAPVTVAWSDATNVAYTTGTLAGTTGTDGKITFSVNADGKLYIENRIGGARIFVYTVLNVRT